MLLKQRRYALAYEQLESGNWRVGIPALNLWVVSPLKGVARRQLKLKVAKAVRLIERGRATLEDSDASADDEWWEIRITSAL